MNAEGSLLRINVSNGGLPKVAVEAPMELTRTGVPGDRQRNLKYHGGPDKAVLMIAAEVVDALAAKGFTVSYGSMGENLTVSGLDPANWRAGQRYRVGQDAEIELTTLREPCANLYPFGKGIGKQLYDVAARAGDIASPVWARGGFYARVVKPGWIGVGAPVALISDIA